MREGVGRCRGEAERCSCSCSCECVRVAVRDATAAESGHTRTAAAWQPRLTPPAAAPHTHAPSKDHTHTHCPYCSLLSSASVMSSPPSASDLLAESSSLPAGWVVGWSRSQGRRFYARAPTATQPEIKQWVPPTHEDEVALSSSSPPPPPLRASSHSHPGVLPLMPEFHAWKPPSEEAVQAESAAVAAATASLVASKKADLTAAERESAEREKDWTEKPKRRRAGLGFGVDDDDEEATGEREEEPAAQRRRGAAGTVFFVGVGGADANTPAAIAAAASTSAAAAFAAASLQVITSDPRRLESASAPRCTVINPPVFATSLDALGALTHPGSNVGSSSGGAWGSEVRYQDVLRSSQVIALNNVYATKDMSLFDAYMQFTSALPPPPERELLEESPTLINAVRHEATTGAPGRTATVASGTEL